MQHKVENNWLMCQDVWSCLFWQHFIDIVWVWHDFVHASDTRLDFYYSTCSNYENINQQRLIRFHKSQSQQLYLQKNFLNITSCLPKFQRRTQLTAVQRESIYEMEHFWFLSVRKETETIASLTFDTWLTRDRLGIISQHLSHRHMWWARDPHLHSVT